MSTEQQSVMLDAEGFAALDSETAISQPSIINIPIKMACEGQRQSNVIWVDVNSKNITHTLSFFHI